MKISELRPIVGTVTAAVSVLALLLVAATPGLVESAAFVQKIGTATRTTGSIHSSLTIPVGAAVTAGNSIIVAGTVSAGGLTGCSDSKGNTYNTDVTAGGGGSSQAFICSSHNVTALTTSDTITVAYGSCNCNTGAVALEFSGLTTISTLDKTAAATGTGLSPDSGTTATTSQANELLVGAVAWNNENTLNMVQAGFTVPATSSLAVGSSSGKRNLVPGYQFVSSTGMFSFSATLNNDGVATPPWRALIATYRIVSTTDATFIVNKDFVPNNASSVTVHLACDSGTISPATTQSATESSPAVFTISGFSPGATCTATEDAVAGHTTTSSNCTSQTITAGGTKICTFTNTSTATFTVNKDFVPNNAATVTVSLACSSGTVSPSGSQTASEGSPRVFTVSGFTNGSTCTASEDPVAGYETTSSGCTSVTINAGDSKSCTFTNTSKATFTVNKDFVPNNAATVNVSLACSSGTVSPSGSQTASESSPRVFMITGFNPGTTTCTASEAAVPGYTTTSSGCTGVPINAGDSKSCLFTNTLQAADSDGDGIADNVDCKPGVFEDKVVDPNNVTGLALGVRRFATLQAAVIAAADNDVISVYGNTSENVIIGATTGSGGKDLLIFGCGKKITAANPANPVIHVEMTAGADDGDTADALLAKGDIHIEDLDVQGGSVGYKVETSKASAGTDTVLKAVRSKSNTVGVSINGNGNKLLGSNVNFNLGNGVEVNGNANFVTDTRIQDNAGNGIDMVGDGNTVNQNLVGGSGNDGDGISFAGNDNLIEDNEVYDNGGDGVNGAGNGNQLVDNRVGDTGKGNFGNGIVMVGDGNIIGDSGGGNRVHANAGRGIDVTGNMNSIVKNYVGDRNKGNGTAPLLPGEEPSDHGIHVDGYGTQVRDNLVYANQGDGINIGGGTDDNPNVLFRNTVGARDGRGNTGNGIRVRVDDIGNDRDSPIEIERNTVRANARNGIWVEGIGHQLKNNVSGGTSSGDDNGDCEFLVAPGNWNEGGNKANGATVPGAVGSPFPMGCIGTP